MSAEQIASQLFQTLANYFSDKVFSYPLVGIVLFGGLLLIFHDFRKWRLSISCLVSLGLTLIFMFIFVPFAGTFTKLFGL